MEIRSRKADKCSYYGSSTMIGLMRLLIMLRLKTVKLKPETTYTVMLKRLERKGCT